jgi:hypothetical protein
MWESKLSYRYWWQPNNEHQFWWRWQSPLEGVMFPSKFLVGYMIILLAITVFSIPVFSAYMFWDNESYKDLLWYGEA